jgi:gliding motility-associated-like protein
MIFNQNNKIYYSLKQSFLISRILLLLLIFTCSPVLFAQNYIFATLDGSPTLNTTGWNLSGNAYVGNTNGTPNTFNDELILTNNANTQSGGIFWAQPINLNICTKWAVEFDFRIFNGSGADGLAFSFLDVPPAGFVSGGGVGLPSASNGLKVIIDTYDNCGGANPELQIFSGVGYGECIAGIIKAQNTGGIFNFIRSNDYRRCRITYDAGNVSVFINNTLYLSGFAPANFVGYMGFTASTGGSNDIHSIKNVVIYTEQASSNAGADRAICNGNTTVIGTANNPNFVYSWSPAAGLSSTTVSNPTVNVVNNGNTPITRTYTVSTSLAANPGVCPTTDQVVVTINPTPSSNFSVSSSNSCTNSNVTITYTGNMAANATYNWNFAGGTIISGSGQGPYVVSWNTTGTKNITLQVAAFGCNSNTTSRAVNVSPSYTSTTSQTVCGSYTWPANGQTYSNSGVYTANFSTAAGCDSVLSLNLTITPAIGTPPPSNFFNSGNNGAGGTLPLGSNDLNWRVATGNINATYIPAVVMTSIPGNYYSSPWPDAAWIAHNPTGSHTVDESYFYKIEFDLACQDLCGGFYNDPSTYCLNLDFFADNSVVEVYVNGVPQSAQITGMPVANPYYHGGFTQNGNVSVSLCNNWQPGRNVLILNVVSGPGYAGLLTQASVNPPPTPIDSVSETICNGINYIFGTQTLTTSGIYTETFQSQYGCDSIVRLDLTVLPTPIVNISENACDSYTAPDGQVYTTSGNYTATIQTAAGCDSTININLTIFESVGGVANNDDIVCALSSANEIVLSNFLGNIQWQYANDFAFTQGVTDILGATDSILSSNEIGLLTSTRYFRAMVSLGPCLPAYSNTITVAVNPLPVITFPALSPICINDNPLNLNTASPVGNGFYSGNGVNNDVFNPSNAGLGSHTITYTFTDTNNCVNSSSSDIFVNDTTALTFANLSDVCVDAPTFNLNAASPSLGTYSGNGVNNNTFNAANAGVGLHTITYNYSNANSCSNSRTATIRVNDLPQVNFSGNNTICVDLPAFGLGTGNPSGGDYTGNGVSNNIFTAANAGVGNHILTYTYTDGNACVNSDTALFVVNALPTLNFPALNDVCLNQPAFVLNTASPSGGDYTGNGISNNIFNPSLAGIGNHVVTYTYTNNIGCINSTTRNIEVLAIPSISITTPNNTICFGETAVLEPNGGINYSWSTVFGGAVSGNGIVSVSPQFTTDYVLRGENNLGCASRDTITVFVNQLPNVTVGSSALSICPQDTAILTANGANNYSWSPSNQIFTNNNNTVRVSPNTQTTFNVIGTDNNGCSNNASITINLFTNPSLVVSASSDTICLGETTAIQVSGANTYLWVPNTNLNSNSSSTVNATPNITRTYFVTGTSVNGCKSTDSISIYVLPLPTIQINSSSNFMCIGDSVVLNASGASSYLWTPSSSLSSDTGSTVLASPTQTTTYFVSGTANTGCKSDANITINVAPPLQLLSQGTTMCFNEPGSIVSFGSGGSGNLTYQWSPVDSVYNPNSNITLVNPTQTTTYTITLSDDCGTSPLSQQVTVEVLPLPIVNFGINPPRGCAPLSGSLNNLSFNTNNCVWTYDNQFFSSDCNTTFEFENPGVFPITLTVVDNQGCSNSLTDSIEVFQNPTADFFFMPDSITALNTNVRFDGSISSQDVVSWNWDISNLKTDTNTVSTYLFPETGYYPITLIVSNENNCFDTITYYIQIKDDYAVYIPNSFTPNGDDLNDSFGPIGFGIINSPDSYSMKIFNRWGQLVFESDDLGKQWRGTAPNLNGGEILPNGAYSYVINLHDILGNKRSYTGKVMLLR